jgi:hypothetical protein
MSADTIKAIADVIKALVPFGPIGLAIVGIVVIAWRPKGVGNWIIAVAIFMIAAVFVANRIIGTSDEVLWFDADARQDWGGGDTAFTAGLLPRYISAGGQPLCDADHIGNVVTCWDNRPDGRTPGVDSDVSSTERRWCAYKQSSVKATSARTGGADPGKVYVCARYIRPPRNSWW